MVAHSLWERGATGSNPVTPTRSDRVAAILPSRTAVGDSNAGHRVPIVCDELGVEQLKRGALLSSDR